METERYFIKIDPNKVLLKIVEERVNRAYSILETVEKIIREKLGEKANEMNLCLLLGNSVKSTRERDNFLEILKKKGIKEEDIKTIERSLEEVASLLF